MGTDDPLCVDCGIVGFCCAAGFCGAQAEVLRDERELRDQADRIVSYQRWRLGL